MRLIILSRRNCSDSVAGFATMRKMPSHICTVSKSIVWRKKLSATRLISSASSANCAPMVLHICW